MSKYYYVYILTNKYNTVLYIGVTSNLIKRLWQHRNKQVEGFTQRYNIIKLVHYEIYEDISETIRREKTMKNLVRRKKIVLIKSKNPSFGDLSEEILSAS